VKVHFLTQDDADPATRFRVMAFLPHLEERGYQVRQDVVPPGGRTRRLLLEATADADVVVLQRRLFNLRDQSRLRRHARRLVFDFDDTIMLKDRGRGSGTRSGRFSRIVRQADLVIAGNAYLEAATRRYTRRVVVLPTVVDTERFAPRPVAAPGPLTLGWIGSHSTVPYLEARTATLAEAATRLAAAGIEVQVEVIADRFGGLPERVGPATLRRTPWSEDVEVPAIHRLDLGLMPLPDDPWTRGKCGFKLLQYLACEVPAVADPVGVNREILAPAADGTPVGGLLPTDDAAWCEAIVQLGQDPGRRRELGRRGRERVEASYSVCSAVPRLAALLERVVAGAGAS
jgi:glycosyltransferase involved in cell wall biosynthesis